MASLYKIAAGWNNAGGLTSITALQDANGVYFPPPRSIPDEGLREFTPRGPRTKGYPVSVLVIPLLIAQYKYIETTFSGNVTVTTTLDLINYANYNAIASLQKRDELEGQRRNWGALMGTDMPANFNGQGWDGVQWTWVLKEAL
jgi:hypothetical protein